LYRKDDSPYHVAPMIVDLGILSHRERYRWMTAAIVPRPIALVSTISEAGAVNLAPFSYFTGISSTPPILAISVGPGRNGRKDTVRNLEATKEMTVSVVTEEIAEPMVLTSGDWPPDRNEFEVAGLHSVPSDLVRPPRVAESPLAMECRVIQVVPVGPDPTFVVLAEIVRIHARESILTDGLPDPVKLRPLGRLGGDLYARMGEILRIPRPKP